MKRHNTPASSSTIQCSWSPFIVYPPYIKSQLFIHHTTSSWSSLITHGFILSNLERWRCCSTTWGGWHFIIDEAFNVEEQTILMVVQIVEANRTLQPMHDSGKSDAADGAVVVTASWRQGLLVFLVVIVLLVRLLPQEMDKPCI
jgi:hypothetical protein